jgi:hypothetical protein
MFYFSFLHDRRSDGTRISTTTSAHTVLVVPSHLGVLSSSYHHDMAIKKFTDTV